MTSFPLTLALPPQAGRGNTPSPARAGEGWGDGGISANAVIHGRQALLRSSIASCFGRNCIRTLNLRSRKPALAHLVDFLQNHALNSMVHGKFFTPSAA